VGWGRRGWPDWGRDWPATVGMVGRAVSEAVGMAGARARAPAAIGLPAVACGFEG
jgi:hypothetical protein